MNYGITRMALSCWEVINPNDHLQLKQDIDNQQCSLGKTAALIFYSTKNKVLKSLSLTFVLHSLKNLIETLSKWVHVPNKITINRAMTFE